MIRRVIANTGWLLADKAIRFAAGITVGVWLARYLGPSSYGLYNYALSFAALFTTCAALGLDTIVVRELVRAPEHKNEIIGSAFLLKLAGGTGALLIAVGASLALHPGKPFTTFLVALISASAIFQSLDSIDFSYQAQVKAKLVVAARTSAFVICTGIKVMLILRGATVAAFIWVTLLEAALTAAALILIYRIDGHNLASWQFSRQRAASLLASSWPLTLSSLAVMVYMRIDQVMLGNMLSDREVGVYSAAIRLSEMWYLVPVLLTTSLYPKIIELKKQGETRYYKRLQDLYDYMVVLGLVVTIPVSLFSSTIVEGLFGSTYAGAATVLSIHIWTGVFVAVGIVSSKWYVVEELQKVSFYRTVAGALVNVVLNLFLIPRAGAVGAAISTLVAQILSSYLFDAFAAPTRIAFRMKTQALFLVHPLRSIWARSR